VSLSYGVQQFALVALALATALPIEGQVGKAYPVDDALADPELFAFRARLLGTIVARDTAELYRLLDPAITNSFGGDGGIAEFKEMWRPHEDTSHVWAHLVRALSFGGRRGTDSVFVAPYTFDAIPSTLGGDTHEYAVVAGVNVLVRREPSAAAPAIAALSFDIVVLDTARASWLLDGWAGVVLSSGRIGYVASRFVHYPLDYRICLKKSAGRWVISCFVAGD
jgi:hypothetical protein